MSVTDPIVTFVLILVIGIVAGILSTGCWSVLTRRFLHGILACSGASAPTGD